MVFKTKFEAMEKGLLKYAFFIDVQNKSYLFLGISHQNSKNEAAAS